MLRFNAMTAELHSIMLLLRNQISYRDVDNKEMLCNQVVNGSTTTMLCNHASEDSEFNVQNYSHRGN